MPGPPLSRDLAMKQDNAVLNLATVLVRHRRWIIGVPLATALVTLGGSFLMTRNYTATTTFVPEARSSSRIPAGLVGIAGLAGQLGLSLSDDPTRSPRFYVGVLNSRQLLERVLRSYYVDYRTGSQTADSVQLLHLLGTGGRDNADSLSRALRRLRKLVLTQIDNQTGMLRLSVTVQDPALAADVANRFVTYLNEFNAQTRQSQARERRKFVEQRMAAAEEELGNAEERLRSFYERNRSWEQSPQLTFEEGRLRRQVEIRQEVYLTLRREYETARVEEVNDTPVITVIDAASPPQESSKPKRLALTLLALVLGSIVGIVVAFALEYLERVRREDPEQYQELTSLLRPRAHVDKSFAEAPGSLRRTD